MAKKEYKPVKKLGKPRTYKESVTVKRRLEKKYPNMIEKHATAVKEAREPWWVKLPRKAREQLKGKKKKPVETLRTKSVKARLKTSGINWDEDKPSARLKGKQ